MSKEDSNYLNISGAKEERLITDKDNHYSSRSPQSHSRGKEVNYKAQDAALRKLALVSVICLFFMAIEVIGGYLANSIAIMSDAAHLLSDFLGFIISILSILIAKKGATNEMSFGFHRAEIIGALVSVTLIWGLTIWLLYEATIRIMNPPEVDGFIMLVVAVIGFIFNLIMGLVLAYQGVAHSHFGHSHGEGGCGGHSHAGHDHHSHGAHDNHSHSGHNHDHAGHDHHDHAGHDHHDHAGHDHHDHAGHDHHDHAGHDHHDHAGHDHHDHSGHDHARHDHHDHHSHKEDAHSHNNQSVGYASHSRAQEPEGMNVNVRAAMIHVIGDALQNVGVVVAGLIIYFVPSLSIADPICTYIFSIIVVFTTIRILKDCIGVLMEGSPIEFDIESLEKDLMSIPGVIEVHDLHVWSLSLGKLSLSCHLSSQTPQVSLKKARKIVKSKYKITHSTIQVELDSERNANDCKHDLHQ